MWREAAASCWLSCTFGFLPRPWTTSPSSPALRSGSAFLSSDWCPAAAPWADLHPAELPALAPPACPCS